MAVVVEFTTIPEMFDRITMKFAYEHRPMLMRKVVEKKCAELIAKMYENIS